MNKTLGIAQGAIFLEQDRQILTYKLIISKINNKMKSELEYLIELVFFMDLPEKRMLDGPEARHICDM